LRLLLDKPVITPEEVAALDYLRWHGYEVHRLR
jgi:hypothetical protein